MSNHPIFVPKFCIFFIISLGGCFRFCSVGWNLKHFPLHLYLCCWGKSCPSLIDTEYTHRISLFVWWHLFHSLHALKSYVIFFHLKRYCYSIPMQKLDQLSREKTKERYYSSEQERKNCSSSFPEENNNRFCCKKLILVFSKEWRGASCLIESWRRVPIPKRTPPTWSSR